MKEDKRTADDKRRDVFLGRRAGMSPDARERVNAENAELIWTGTCRKCHVQIKGTIEQCRSHKCNG